MVYVVWQTERGWPVGWLERVSRTKAELQPTRMFRPSIPDDASGTEQRFGLSQLMEMFSHQGVGYSVYGGDHQNVERDTTSFLHYVNSYYRDNGVVFAVVLARLLLFTEARFLWQRTIDGRPGDLFSTPALDLLERPWPNGTTGDLLARMEQDVSLHGNFYAVKESGRIRRLRPDWVEIVLDAAPAEAVASNIQGYLYRPGGSDSRTDPKLYLPHEMAHWAPVPDPLAQYRGMSWVTPVIREVLSDRSASEHKLKFFDNAATPNLAVSFSENITQQQFQAFMSAMNAAHQGSSNAYKTMYLGGGADVKVIGANMEQMDFKSTQGAGETRICAAGGVPPIIVGLSEGLSSATYSNYGMARRKFGDHWARPQWRSACAALSTLIEIPHNARLWYDDRDIAFLREDQKDVASIQTQQASTMKQLIDAGFEPESVTTSLMNEDWSLLEHTGLFSVQLQPPGSTTPTGGEPPATPSSDGPPATPLKPRAPSGEPDSGGGGSEAGSAGENVPATKEEADRGYGSRVESLERLVETLQVKLNTLARSAERGWNEQDHPRDPAGKWDEHGPGGIKSPDAKPARPTKGGPRLADVVGDPDALTAAVQDVVSRVQLPEGVEVKSARSAGSAGAWWKIRLQDRNGEEIAFFSRKVKTDADGNRYIQHSEAEVEPEWQRKGIASAMNREFEDWYKESGIDTVKLQAEGASDLGRTGGFVWAKAGYDWDDHVTSETVEGALSRVRAIATERGDEQLVEQIDGMTREVQATRDRARWPAPIELAMLGHRPETDDWPGKTVMSDTSWDGKKRLV